MLAAPRVRNASHTVVAHVSVPDGGCEGALYSDGDRWAGMVRFVQNDRACVHDQFPIERHEIRGEEPLAPGDHTTRWTLTAVDRVWGRGELFVDDELVAAVDIPRVLRGFAAFGGVSLGCDLITPVGTTDESPFRFTGVLHRVEVEIDDESGADGDAELRNEIGEQ